MSDKTRLGFGVLTGSLALGVLGDLLLRATPWGLNLFLCTTLLLAAIALLVRWQRVALTGNGFWLVVPALFFSAAWIWRDSVTLNAVNLLAVLVSLALVALRGRAGEVRLAGVMEYLLGLLFAAFYLAIGPILLLIQNIRREELPKVQWSGQAAAVGRGLAIAIPALLVFGALFVSADAAFAGIVSSWISIDIREPLVHLAIIAGLTWVFCGLMRQTLLGPRWSNPVPNVPPSMALGIVEAGIVLGLLNALFLVFVVVQGRYFFGGAPLVEASTNLTYAEYARRGFFELVAVAALVLPMLLLAEWIVSKARRNEVLIFRALSGLLVILLFVIMASALQRMRLYQSEFGLTELRLYTTAFMGWLAIVFLWFMATVLRGQRNRFAFGALVAALLTGVVLNGLNPDEFIVRANASRVQLTRPFDGEYAASLSGDAVGAVVEALPAMREEERREVAQQLLDRWSSDSATDWRTWNWGREQARSVVKANQETLRKMAQP